MEGKSSKGSFIASFPTRSCLLKQTTGEKEGFTLNADTSTVTVLRRSDMRHLISIYIYTFAWYLCMASELSQQNCTPEEASKIAHRFRKSGRFDDGSRCPRETWLEAMASVDELPTKLFLNIGFNKGYNFAVWANLFAPWTGYFQLFKQFPH